MIRTLHRSLVVCCILLATLSALAVGSDKERKWTAGSALKEMDKALKDVHGLTGQVFWDELVCSERYVGSGKFYVSDSGEVRADIDGDPPRTIIVLRPFFYIYKPNDGIAQRYYLPSRPDLMGQYAVLGFSPAGSDLKKDYKVSMVRTEALNDRQTVVLNLVPKSEEVRAAISAIVLWVDQETWLPYQQLIRHTSSGLQATIRYTDLAADNDLSKDLFQKVWPDDTKIVAE